MEFKDIILYLCMPFGGLLMICFTIFTPEGKEFNSIFLNLGPLFVTPLLTKMVDDWMKKFI